MCRKKKQSLVSKLIKFDKPKKCTCGVKSLQGILINLRFFCDVDCAIKFGKEKAKKEKDKKLRKDVSDLNKRTLSWQLNATKTVFNKMRRLQELEWFQKKSIKPYCISCLKENMDWCCGHFKTVGSRGDLRFDLKNTYLQCNNFCNKNHSGNINGAQGTVGYIAGIKHRFGEVDGQKILDYCEVSKIKHWSCEELEQMRTQFSNEIRRLEKCLN